MKEITLIEHRDRMMYLSDACNEIRQLYDTRHAIGISWNFTTNQPGRLSPVERALLKIDKQTELLEQEARSYYAESAEIEKWLSESVKDPIMKAIIRARFLTDSGWRKVGKIIYGKPDADRARNYYQEHKKEVLES